ncbi:hypothetical protein ACM46_13765 [Chryseobacterium angstadtii]|uniref:Tail sheath protein subtilisin-like domain-containing protein n=1 Tax=Chryseobacterium angstadtii TaxID=558151 RepID=A0A0J7I9L2_9FLAO|nr:DUF2586 family protein [Chryseobacterium angstadtii]KMQ63012.1 hypothetical protein ACM46_13765 [Chryseobacterium angstadtii]
MSQGNGTPKVKANVASGNLLRQIQVIDGVAGIVGTAYKPGNIGRVERVYSPADAKSKGYTEQDEPFLFQVINEFYQELGGSQELWILGTKDTTTMKAAVASTNEEGVKGLLNYSNGRVNLVAVCRKPDAAYVAPAGFLDKDVEDALIASATLGAYQQSINKPVRIFIEGRVKDASAISTFEPKSAENTFAGVVLGGSKNDGSASVALVLARACKYPAHVKIGDGQNGSLSITEAFIGDKKVDEYLPEQLDNFTDAGFITFHTREGSAGYYFSVDKMAGMDDFRTLVHGRLIDKAQRISTATDTPFLESSVRLTPDGKLNEADAVYLEEVTRAQLLNGMAGQISGAQVLVSLDQDLINTNTLQKQIQIQPLGYMTWIVLNMGLTKTI